VALMSNKSGRALGKAQAEVARLEQAVARWRSDAEVKRAALAELERGAGDAVLADETGTVGRQLAVDATELRYGIDGADKAAEAARRQLGDARDELALAQAAQLREQAAKLTREADAHRAKVDDLLAQLEALDGPRYVAYEPSPEEQRDALQTGRSLSWIESRTVLLRDPIGPLLAEAEALERPVLEKRRALEAASRPLVPSARVELPRWDDVDAGAVVCCEVSEGAGAVTFEVGHGEYFEPLVTLPDDAGWRVFRKLVRLRPGGRLEVRCNGEVLAAAERPGRLRANDVGVRHVQLSKEERQRV
jgi:hypothetical protein